MTTRTTLHHPRHCRRRHNGSPGRYQNRGFRFTVANHMCGSTAQTIQRREKKTRQVHVPTHTAFQSTTTASKCVAVPCRSFKGGKKTRQVHVPTHTAFQSLQQHQNVWLYRVDHSKAEKRPDRYTPNPPPPPHTHTLSFNQLQQHRHHRRHQSHHRHYPCGRPDAVRSPPASAGTCRKSPKYPHGDAGSV